MRPFGRSPLHVLLGWERSRDFRGARDGGCAITLDNPPSVNSRVVVSRAPAYAGQVNDPLIREH